MSNKGSDYREKAHMREIEIHRQMVTHYFIFDDNAGLAEVVNVQRRLREVPGVANATVSSSGGTMYVSAQLLQANLASDEYRQALQACTHEIMCVIGALTRFNISPQLPIDLLDRLNRWSEARDAACLSRHDDPDEVREAYERECGDQCRIA